MHIIKGRTLPDRSDFVPGRSVSASQLERWLGPECLESISSGMVDWHGPPIALGGVPGKVYATKGGDFRGELRAGFEATIFDRAWDIQKRLKRSIQRVSKNNRTKFNALTSLSDIIAEAAAGKRRDFLFQKAGTTGVVSGTNTLWYVGAQPSAGGAAAAAPGGTQFTDASAGGFPFTNPTNPDTQHFVYAAPNASAINTLLLYDRLCSVTKDMTITTAQAVTVATPRYQSQVGTDADYIGGNFIMFECRTALNAVAHNWTACQYTDQDGNATQALPSVTGNSSCIVNRLDHPLSSWFCPLAAGDTGIKTLTQIQYSAVATGAVDVTLGHPIAFMPMPIANITCNVDGINTAFSMARIFDDACLAFLEINKPATTATNYNGMFTTVAG